MHEDRSDEMGQPSHLIFFIFNFMMQTDIQGEFCITNIQQPNANTTNFSTIDVVNAFDDVAIAFEKLTAYERDIEYKYAFMEKSLALADEVKKFGFTDITNDHLRAFENINDLIDVSVEKLIQFQATESLVDKAKDTVKKFIDAIKEFIKKCIEFIQKIFNTLSHKCRTILMNLPNLQFDKKAMLMGKNELALILAETNACRLFMLDVIPGFTYSKTPDYLVNWLAYNCKTLIISDTPTSIKINNDAFKLKEMTLDDGKWSINDCGKLVQSFNTRTNDYTKFGQIMHDAATKMWNAYSYLVVNMKPARETWRIEVSTYSLLSKAQNVVAKIIVGFYKCLGPGITLAEGDQGGPAQLTYTK